MWLVCEIRCELLSLKEMKLGETDKQEKKPRKPQTWEEVSVAENNNNEIINSEISAEPEKDEFQSFYGWEKWQKLLWGLGSGAYCAVANSK